MSRLLSPRERVVIGSAAALVLVGGGHLFFVEPLVARARDVGALVPIREATLERRRLLVGQRARLADELTVADARLATESARLLRGPTPPLAAAELQRLVKEILPRTGLEIRSERVLPVVDRQNLQEIGIELTLVGPIRDTATALSHLERSDHLLAVKDVRMRVLAAGQPRDPLTTLTVAGYLLPTSVASRQDASTAADHRAARP